MNTYKTRNQGLAAVLRYALGSDAHLRTYLEPKGPATFEFADNGECWKIAQQFLEGEFGVTDTKTLVKEFVAVRRTLTVAIRSGSEWRNQCLHLV